MEVLADLSEHIDELKAGIDSADVFGPFFSIGPFTFSITQYTIWLVVDLIIVLIIVFYAKSRVSMVPRGFFPHGVEWLVDFTQRDIAEGIIGRGYRKHLNMLLTIFIFILISNLIGLIPGAKPSTGTMGATWALSLIVFVYFNYYGIKRVGFFRYCINLAPKGVPAALVWLIWLIELASLFLRLVTLAVRLFANMFAGHMVLGTFAVLTQLFVMPLIAQFTMGNLVTALPAIIWIAFLIAMYAMEVLVACIQAYVFTMLTAVYISLATSEH